MQHFVLPTPRQKFVEIRPCLGPLEFQSKQEHEVEEYVRVYSLLVFAQNFQTSTFRLDASDTERDRLFVDAPKILIHQGAAKRLGLDNQAFEKEVLDPKKGPVWMQDKVTDPKLIRRRVVCLAVL